MLNYYLVLPDELKSIVFMLNPVIVQTLHLTDNPVAQMVKNLPAMQETKGSISELGRSSGEGNSNLLQ